MPKDIDIGQKILGMEQLLRRTLGEHIECEFQLDPGLWLASVDPGQLASALLNLVLNARDAMPSGGKLTVEVRNTSLGESDVDVNGEARPGDYVMVAVTDTGSGMSAEVAGRAFEPFFTTKEVGKGTGLGLSMVYGFAQQSGGSMQIRSEPGQGTAVRLFFPRVDAPQVNAAPSVDQRAAPAGSETILVVEDDDMVRAYVENELKALGYRVIVTRNAPAALAILRRPEQIHLLFTDVVMPGGMFGPELATEAVATAARPENSLHLRLQRTSRRSARWTRPRGADPEQALPAARSGADAAFGAEGGLMIRRGDLRATRFGVVPSEAVERPVPHAADLSMQT